MFQLDYLELPSTDGAATRAFFVDAFAWGMTDFGPTYTQVEGAGLLAGIDSSGERVAAPLPVIRTDDLDAAQAAVERAGGVLSRPQYDFPGGRRFHFRAPGGVEMAVYVERHD